MPNQFDGKWHYINKFDGQTVDGMNTPKGLLLRHYYKKSANFGSVNPTPLPNLRIVKRVDNNNNENWVIEKRNLVDRLLSLITLES